MVTGTLHKHRSWDTIIKQFIWSSIVPVHLLTGASFAANPEMYISAGFSMKYKSVY